MKNCMFTVALSVQTWTTAAHFTKCEKDLHTNVSNELCATHTHTAPDCTRQRSSRISVFRWYSERKDRDIRRWSRRTVSRRVTTLCMLIGNIYSSLCYWEDYRSPKSVIRSCVGPYLLCNKLPKSWINKQNRSTSIYAAIEVYVSVGYVFCQLYTFKWWWQFTTANDSISDIIYFYCSISITYTS